MLTDLLNDVHLQGVIVLALVSLFLAFVLFKLLGSTGVITNKQYQVGGAIVGFLVIFRLLFWAWSESTLNVAEPTWTVQGTVTEADGSPYSGYATVAQTPVVPVDTHTGFFILPEVRTSKGKLPTIYIAGDSNHVSSPPLEVTKTNSKITGRMIQLNTGVPLTKVLVPTPTGATVTGPRGSTSGTPVPPEVRGPQ